jgi:predicted DNA binding CopG/RHH family protein
VALLDAVKLKAKVRGVPYAGYIREVLEQAMAAKPERPRR